MVFSYLAIPAVRRVTPREGAGAGGEPVFLAGSNLHMGTGGGISGFGASPHCLSPAGGYAYLAMVVSSALLVCEEDASRPSFYAAQKPMSGRQKSQSGSRNPGAWR